MNADQVLAEFDRQIEDARERELTNVTLESLRALVNELRSMHEGDGEDETVNDEFRLEEFKAKTAHEIEEFRHDSVASIEATRSTNAAGDAAMQAKSTVGYFSSFHSAKIPEPLTS